MIKTKQKQCLRIIHKAKYNAHTEPLFFKSRILPLEDLILHQKLVLMHSLVYGYSAVTFHDFYPNRDANLHNFALRNDNDFFVIRSNNSFVHKMPLIDFPMCWNLQKFLLY